MSDNGRIKRLLFIACILAAILIAFYILLDRTAKQQQTMLRLLAFGDSLTAGYYNSGRSFHPYSTHMTQLFQLANIPAHIDQRGVSGELVVPSMVNRLRKILEVDPAYDLVIILGGTNDLGHGYKGELIFKQGLQPMYEMCLNHPKKPIKVIAMTVIENAFDVPASGGSDLNRQTLNKMIRDFVSAVNNPEKILLVDLDQAIPYHRLNASERRLLWDDAIHLTPVGYDNIAKLVFSAITQNT